MWFSSIFAVGKSPSARTRLPRAPAKSRRGLRLNLEQLEDRTLLSSYTAATVSDLIKDVNAANRSGGSNTIALAANTTFALTKVDNTTDGPTGVPAIAAGDTLTIVGNGDTIERSMGSGTPAFRVFDVARGASLTLDNLTLQNGLAFGSGVAAEGGAIYSEGTVVLSAVTVQGNVALGSDGAAGTSENPNGGAGQDAAGGGLYVGGGALTVENDTLLQHNSAVGGAGGTAYGYSSFGGNGGNGFGGGLYVGGGSAILSNATAEFNAAYGGAGGNASQGYYYGHPGSSFGGGIYFASAATYSIDPLTVVVAHNTAAIDPDADPPTSFFVLSGLLSTTTAGVAQSFTVTVESDFGHVVTNTNYTGTVHFSSSNPQAVLPSDYTFTTANGGVHAFSATLKTASGFGTQTITVTDKANAELAATQAATVNPAAASTIVALGFPVAYTSESGSLLTVIFQDFDPYGNIAYGSTFNISSTDPLATFPTRLTQSPYQCCLDFVVTFATVGAQTLTVTEATNLNVTATGVVNVVPWGAVNAPPTHEVPNIGYGGPDAEVAVNEPVTYTLTAGGGGIPSGAIFTFTVDWGQMGSPVQTLTGPSGTTVTHTYTTSTSSTPGHVTIEMTVTYNGFTNSGAYEPSLSVGFLASIEPDPAKPSQYALVFNVNFGDSLTLSPAANNGVVKLVRIDGQTTPITINAPGNVPFAHLLVYGDSYPHQISLTGGLSVPALIFVDGTLDTSGSTANNVLVGQGGNDTLKGGSGRDILIAGRGAGTLEAGSGDDILVGGYTTYGNNITALLAIMAEWGRTDADYNTRVDHLLGTLAGGLNGSYFLNSSTVLDNGVADILDGGAGMDWFLAGTTGNTKDTIKNKTIGEVVTSI